ncbi:hypothetical protein NQ314_019458 [Rhamnusium bicolor]|uniref:Uncharacterized protein n=1 Tax=Rhamnusium bicolor TaxID=1586634 RepID=A0AAV8WMN6_9CUCU|nr:hypothetical protein NQ314_019458 [Rhamnusium bicolor]
MITIHYITNPPHEELTDSWSKFSSYKPNDWANTKTELKSTTITIPIVKNNNVVDLSWNDVPEKDIKRHSIAVDESKYFIKEDDDDINTNRKPKKVEFCKTEVHFAAESGKVNIVATDEKPPPTQNFRRRRRSSGLISEDFNKNGLPVLHFGDSSYEKTMFGVADELSENRNSNFTSIYENVQSRVPLAFGIVTVNTNNNVNNEIIEEDKRELTENDSIKGILKNKPIKPKPYHLGETVPFSDTNSDDENKNWGD